MVKTENNPYYLLEKQGISMAMLSPKATEALALFDKANKVSAKHPKSQEVKEQAEKAGQIAGRVIEKDIERIKLTASTQKENEEKQAFKKVQSKTILEKSAQVMDDLSLCRQRLKEERQKKIASGEIQPPKKKLLAAKLRGDLLKIVSLIPKKLKDDPDVIDRTRQAMLRFLNELKDIWGMTKIKPIQDELNEKFNKLQEQAA